MSENICLNCKSHLQDSNTKVCPVCGFAYPCKNLDKKMGTFTTIIIIIFAIACFIPPFFLVFFIFLFFYFKPAFEYNAQKKSVKNLTVNTNTTLKEIYKTAQPFESRLSSTHKYKMINGVAEIWRGQTKPASFKTFDEKITGSIVGVKVLEDGDFYIEVASLETGEIKLIKEREISSKIVVGSTRYDFMDLCRKPLKLELTDVFDFVNEVREEARKPFFVCNLTPTEARITYSSKTNGRSQRFVIFDKYYQSKTGVDYIQGFCKTREEERLFKVKNIESKLKVGSEYYYPNEFIEKFKKINVN